MTAIIVIVVVVILAAWLVSMYNSLVKMRNNRENAFADIDVQLKQRHDLVPQLVETVKDMRLTKKIRWSGLSMPATGLSVPKPLTRKL